MITLTKLINILANKAVQNPEILKPLTTDETSMRTRALITNRNNPNEKSVSGRVSKINRGLIIALAKPNMRADTASEEAFSK